MSTKIRRLSCRIRVISSQKKSIIHSDEKPAKPSMRFAQPNTLGQTETLPQPSDTATENPVIMDGIAPRVSPKNADTKAVADRVYEIIKEETLMSQLRRGH